ncbi:hypothetical protein [Dysgonomonas sp. BGC7]|uniref:hypothetical protein n=1 Tax=Dysgonomonas sp. BGC7 TaxID=1658008 RepID=UPI00067FEE9A|nr:hypothetical protein [Dysgonomonas sp. BGC7]MBD8388132.1 hypothetical protein [Dysgonomonas sp. BGC7]
MKKTLRSNSLLLLITIFSVLGVKAQITIGAGIEPNGGALLDLKEFAAGSLNSNNETSTKGMLYPRVELLDIYKKELHPMYDVAGTSYNTNKVVLKKNHIGLIVFNVTNSVYFSSGLYLWNGEEWRRLEDSPLLESKISDLLCAGALMTPSSYTAGTPFDGVLRISYIGGTGGGYEGTATSAPVNGLQIERLEGRLAIGGGEVLYRVFGTPTVSSPTTTTFPISFLDKTCNITVGSGVSSVNIRNLSADVLVTSPYANDSPGTANQLAFGDITITEAGSYAFSLRLYGKISIDDTKRWPFYIYLQKNNKTTVLDAAEIDLVTVPTGGYPDYSYSITLGGVFDVNDKVLISMHRPAGSLTGLYPVPTWTLSKGFSSNSPVRTSLIYWKL